MDKLKKNPFYQLNCAMNDTEVYLFSNYGENGFFSLKHALKTIFYWYVQDVISDDFYPIGTSISDYIKENYSIFIKIM